MNNLESGKKLFRNKSRIASNSPGVYQILDDKNKVIYVGKAKNLPKRLQIILQNHYYLSGRSA